MKTILLAVLLMALIALTAISGTALLVQYGFLSPSSPGAAPGDSLRVREATYDDTIYVEPQPVVRRVFYNSVVLGDSGFSVGFSRPQPALPLLTIWRGTQKTLYILGDGRIYVQGWLVATDTATANTLKEAYSP